MIKRWNVTWSPWFLLVLAAAVSATDVVIVIQNNQAAGQPVPVTDWLVSVESWLLPTTFTAVGAFVVTRRPGNRIGWLMIAIGLSSALAAITSDYVGQGDGSTRSFISLAAWIGAWDWTFLPISLLLLLLLFPTGEVPGRRWKPVLWVGLAAWGALSVLSAVRVGAVGGAPVDNPFGFVFVPEIIVSALGICGLAMLPAAVLSLVVRFRSAQGNVRQQIKWFTYGAALAITFEAAAFLTSWSNTAVVLLALASVAALPIFMGVAILRYHLYDIDVLINRTLVYGSLSASLAILYITGVVSLQALFRLVAGQSSELAVAISTLAIAALFQPLRRWIQAFIDRRFYRRKYDAAQTLTAFQGKLRSEVDLDDLTGDLLGVVQETMQPAHVSVWLR